MERTGCAAPDEPFGLVEKQKGALRLAACNAAARAAGLRAGLTLAEARARIPALAVADADDAADRRLLRALADAADRFSPLVACDGCDGLMIDITGCPHLFGGEDRMRQKVMRFFSSPPLPSRGRGQGEGVLATRTASNIARTHPEVPPQAASKGARAIFTLRAAIAGTPEAAHVLARFSEIGIVPPGMEAQAVARLPVAALDAEAETTTALIRAGLKTIADLASRPSAALTARFGAPLTVRLARVLGRELMPVTPLRPAPEIAASRAFPEPLLSLDILHGALTDLIAEACAELARRGQGARRFEAAVFRSDGTSRRIAIDTARASRSAPALLKLFALRLETLADPLDPGFGFDGLRLSVQACEALSERQSSLDGKQNDEVALADLVDRLVTRFGRERVVRFVARDTHAPARAAAAVPVDSPAPSAPWPVGDLPRPLHVFASPQPIEAMAEVPDAPPVRFRWRKVLHEVVASEGPERIAPEWWRDMPHEARPRDYYRVEDKGGRRFWLFREGLFGDDEPPRWFIHGLFP